MSVPGHSVLAMDNALSIGEPDEQLPSRPAKEAVSEIAAMSLLTLFAAFALGNALSGDTRSIVHVFSLAPAAGAVILDHIGWAFGVYIPILLGFYVIVIGGQLAADPSAGRTRRTLGFVAEAMTAGLVPALALIVAACIADPSQAGALFVVAPVSAIMFFLAIQLGGFIVFERSLRLASAQNSRDWARHRLTALRHRSRKPVWLVVIVNSIIGGMIGLGTRLLLTRPADSVAVLFLLYGLIPLVLAVATLHGFHAFYTARDRTTRVLAWFLPSGVYLLFLTLAATLFVSSKPAAATSMLALLTFSLVSTFWPRNRGPRFLLNWTVRGGATRYAARSVTRTYVRSARKVRDLSTTPDAAAPLRLTERLISALQAFRDGALTRTSEASPVSPAPPGR